MSKTIAIVGGGFCGTLCAVHLLQIQPRPFNRIVLIDAGERVARGVAYATREPQHLLNVPAGRMSAFMGDREHFLRFAQTIDPNITGADFLPRKLYGDYLETLLRDAEKAAAQTGVEFLCVNESVVDVRLQADASVQIELRSGVSWSADKVILALGNGAPRAPSIAGKSFSVAGSRYIDDPWTEGALAAVDFTQPVLLIGTGLTAVDIVTALRARGLRSVIHAISRHGLLPLAHRGLSHAARELPLPLELLQQPVTVKALLRNLRGYIRRAAMDNIDWRDILAALRRVTPQLWRSLDTAQRARFLRHCQTYWDVHRHRVAPTIGAQFAELVATRQLHVRAARLNDFQYSGERIKVQVRNRCNLAEEWLTVGTVINCTGPASNIERSPLPLWQALLARGLVARDEFAIGVKTADNYALIDASGQPSSSIYYVGPLLKAGYWEATAVPELREHVARLVAAMVE